MAALVSMLCERSNESLPQTIKEALSEFLGAFFLVLTVGLNFTGTPTQPALSRKIACNPASGAAAKQSERNIASG